MTAAGFLCLLLVLALIRMSPRIVSDSPGDEGSTMVLEPRIVLCDVGPVLVVHLQDSGTRRFIWSNAYPLAGEHPEPSLVEQVARDVTAALPRS